MKKFIPFLILAAFILSGCASDMEKYTQLAGLVNNKFECPDTFSPAEWQQLSAITGIDCIPPKPKPNTSVDPIIEEPPDPVKPKPTDTYEKGTWWGRYNGDRGTWYFSRKMADYPDTFIVAVNGCGSFKVTDNNGTRFVSAGGAIVKQSDVAGRGMALVMPKACRSDAAHINL